MIVVEVDKKSLHAVETALGKMKSQAPKVIARAANDTARSARVKLAQKAQEAYTVKSAGFKSRMKIKWATAGSMTAIITAQGRTLTLTRFKTSAPASGAKAQVVKAGGLKKLIKGNIKAWKGSNGQIMQRKTEKRYPLKVLRSNSVPVMLGSEQRVYGIVRPKIESDLQKNIERQINWLLG